MQDVRQSVYDLPRRQLSNTIEGQQPAEAAAHWSAGPAHDRAQAGSVMLQNSQAVETEAAAATEATTEAAQSVAGMDVRQSMYDSSQASPHQSHVGDGHMMTLHSDDMQPPATPFDQSRSHASHSGLAGPGMACSNRQQRHFYDAHPSRSSSDALLDRQDYRQQQSEQEPMPRLTSASWSLVQHGHHDQRQQVHSPAQHGQHAKHEQLEPQHGQRAQQRGQHEPKHGQRELQHGQPDPEIVQHVSGTSEHVHHEAQQSSRAGEQYLQYPQSMYEQSAHASHGSGGTRDANRQYVDRASYSAAAAATQPELTVTYGAAAPVSHQGRHASTARCQASMPVNGGNGWDPDELDVSGTASQPHSHDTQPLSRNESSSLGSEQEAALWDLVNEEPCQVGLIAQHAQHRAFEYSQQSSQQSSHQASRIPSSRPSSAGSSSHVSQQYGHRPSSKPASQMQRGEFQSAEHWSRAGNKTVFGLFATLL